jgi:hypothetical protein
MTGLGIAERPQDARVAGEGGELAEVDARRENGPFAAQHDAMHGGVVTRRSQRIAELQEQRLVHRVALLRAVQHDVADRAAVFA